MSAPFRTPFDIPGDLAYLNCAYLSPLMGSVVAAGLLFIDVQALDNQGCRCQMQGDQYGQQHFRVHERAPFAGV